MQIAMNVECFYNLGYLQNMGQNVLHMLGCNQIVAEKWKKNKQIK